jgi:Zn finger protein HypA/HybF involved in hydrogenase expression
VFYAIHKGLIHRFFSWLDIKLKRPCVARCYACGRKLTPEKCNYYGTTCERCETKVNRIMNNW